MAYLWGYHFYTPMKGGGEHVPFMQMILCSLSDLISTVVKYVRSIHRILVKFGSGGALTHRIRIFQLCFFTTVCICTLYYNMYCTNRVSSLQTEILYAAASTNSEIVR
jgi:hypothetical protein